MGIRRLWESYICILATEEGDYVEMGKLRERFPSLRHPLTTLHQNVSDTTTSK